MKCPTAEYNYTGYAVKQANDLIIIVGLTRIPRTRDLLETFNKIVVGFKHVFFILHFLMYIQQFAQSAIQNDNNLLLIFLYKQRKIMQVWVVYGNK